MLFQKELEEALGQLYDYYSYELSCFLLLDTNYKTNQNQNLKLQLLKKHKKRLIISVFILIRCDQRNYVYSILQVVNSVQVRLLITKVLAFSLALNLFRSLSTRYSDISRLFQNSICRHTRVQPLLPCVFVLKTLVTLTI